MPLSNDAMSNFAKRNPAIISRNPWKKGYDSDTFCQLIELPLDKIAAISANDIFKCFFLEWKEYQI